MEHIVVDVDDTLAKIVLQEGNPCQVPDYDLIQVLRWFINNGDQVYVWSAGGIDYAKTWVRKLGLYDQVKVIEKMDIGKRHPKMDIAFDDCEIGLAKITVKVKREAILTEKDLGN